jgi:hypothetical protein
MTSRQKLSLLIVQNTVRYLLLSISDYTVQQQRDTIHMQRLPVKICTLNKFRRDLSFQYVSILFQDKPSSATTVIQARYRLAYNHTTSREADYLLSENHRTIFCVPIAPFGDYVNLRRAYAPHCTSVALTFEFKPGTLRTRHMFTWIASKPSCFPGR